MPSLEEIRAEQKRREASRPAPKLADLFPPQQGPQSEFLAAQADIKIYGGAAGGGKTWAELLAAAEHVGNSRYGAVIFRRTMKQVKDEGGIWDQSARIYSEVGATPNLTERYWTFKSGATVQFAGLETEQSKYTYQGAEICRICFDELTHFTEGQFWYLLSRNRSTCGVRPDVLATVNPGSGWVFRLLAPWVDPTFPNRARSGEVRWFIRENNQIVWVDQPPKREPCSCLEKGCVRCFPPEKSLVFIRSSVYDNKELLKANPEYISNLMALPELERRQLLDGDWLAKPPFRVISTFDDTKHVVPWREIPKKWDKFLGMDFGKINTAQVALAYDPDRKKLIVIGEDWPGHERPFESVANESRRICHGTPKTGAGGNRTSEQGWRQAMRKEGIPIEEPDPKHSDPGLQYQCVSDAFASGDLEVMDNCPKTIDMLNNFQHKIGPDGEPMNEFDDAPYHLLAALRYIVTKLRPPKSATNPWDW